MIRSRTMPRLEDNSGGLGQAAGQATRESRNVILIVEDEPVVRMSMEDALLQAGFDVLTSSNGTEALELIANRPHVFAVVSDIAMPGSINGYELAREVQRRWFASLPTLANGDRRVHDRGSDRHARSATFFSEGEGVSERRPIRHT